MGKEMVNFTIRMTPKDAERFRAAAVERDVSANWLARKALAEFLDRLIPVDEIQWTRDPERND